MITVAALLCEVFMMLWACGGTVSLERIKPIPPRTGSVHLILQEKIHEGMWEYQDHA